ncbi:DUF6969 family protein [uncultured Roseibium sp.]|uniref:DUF6969 family protein n=1 Tax=uncultured Roseibium sp. TaxID=1936171 RepID=UPI00321808EE
MSETKTKAPQMPFPADLSGLPEAQLEAMHDAAATVLNCERELAQAGSNVVMEVLRDQGDFLIWERYPKGDLFDLKNHSHYFYHAHTSEEMADGENGHFHLFVRPAAIAPDMKPWRLPGAVVPEDPAVRFAHIGAVSVDNQGRLIRLFTTNRWVTNETLCRADDVIALLDHFAIEVEKPSRAVNRWLTSLITLYRPQLEALLRARDATLEAFKQEHPDSEVLEDRALQNTSEVFVDTVKQIEAVERALGV